MAASFQARGPLGQLFFDRLVLGRARLPLIELLRGGADRVLLGFHFRLGTLHFLFHPRHHRLEPVVALEDGAHIDQRDRP
jgi:hypothetical protein